MLRRTGRDMIEDRNELMAQVWPAPRRLCRWPAVEFVEVDLRWGITAAQAEGRRWCAFAWRRSNAALNSGLAVDCYSSAKLQPC